MTASCNGDFLENHYNSTIPLEKGPEKVSLSWASQVDNAHFYNGNDPFGLDDNVLIKIDGDNVTQNQTNSNGTNIKSGNTSASVRSSNISGSGNQGVAPLGYFSGSIIQPPLPLNLYISENYLSFPNQSSFPISCYPQNPHKRVQRAKANNTFNRKAAHLEKVFKQLDSYMNLISKKDYQDLLGDSNVTLSNDNDAVSEYYDCSVTENKENRSSGTSLAFSKITEERKLARQKKVSKSRRLHKEQQHGSLWTEQHQQLNNEPPKKKQPPLSDDQRLYIIPADVLSSNESILNIHSENMPFKKSAEGLFNKPKRLPNRSYPQVTCTQPEKTASQSMYGHSQVTESSVSHSESSIRNNSSYPLITSNRNSDLSKANEYLYPQQERVVSSIRSSNQRQHPASDNDKLVTSIHLKESATQTIESSFSIIDVNLQLQKELSKIENKRDSCTQTIIQTSDSCIQTTAVSVSVDIVDIQNIPVNDERSDPTKSSENPTNRMDCSLEITRNTDRIEIEIVPVVTESMNIESILTAPDSVTGDTIVASQSINGQRQTDTEDRCLTEITCYEEIRAKIKQSSSEVNHGECQSSVQTKFKFNEKKKHSNNAKKVVNENELSSSHSRRNSYNNNHNKINNIDQKRSDQGSVKDIPCNGGQKRNNQRLVFDRSSKGDQKLSNTNGQKAHRVNRSRNAVEVFDQQNKNRVKMNSADAKPLGSVLNNNRQDCCIGSTDRSSAKQTNNVSKEPRSNSVKSNGKKRTPVTDKVLHLGKTFPEEKHSSTVDDLIFVKQGLDSVKHPISQPSEVCKRKGLNRNFKVSVSDVISRYRQISNEIISVTVETAQMIGVESASHMGSGYIDPLDPSEKVVIFYAGHGDDLHYVTLDIWNRTLKVYTHDSSSLPLIGNIIKTKMNPEKVMGMWNLGVNRIWYITLIDSYYKDAILNENPDSFTHEGRKYIFTDMCSEGRLLCKHAVNYIIKRAKEYQQMVN